MKSVLLLRAIIVPVALWLSVGQGELLANGATRLLVKDAIAGPYLLQVGIIPGTPRVGTLHVTVLVNEAAGGTPITDVLIDVTADGPEGATDTGPVRAVNSVLDLRFYEADLPLDAEGVWTLTVDVDGPLGPGQFVREMQVRQAQRLDLVWVLAVAVALAAIGIWIWDRIRAGRRRRQNES